MTSKDYEKFAGILKERKNIAEVNVQHGGDSVIYESHLEVIDALVEEFCVIFEEDNPNFDEDLFRDACGT